MAGKSQLTRQMQNRQVPVSLADLSAAGVRLRPFEAVTLVRELVLQVARGDVAGVPSAHVIRLSRTGAVFVEGPVEAGGPAVVRAAQLLESLLPPSEAGGQSRMPGGLKLVLGRALGTLDLPPFPSPDAFADALSRFAATDPPTALASLVGAMDELVSSRRPEPAAEQAPPTPAHVEPFVGTPAHGAASEISLTVSDIRRARRATGLPLALVAERSRIPLGLLRQLEWGYLHNWPTGQYGRSQLIRYSRATGLDQQLVLTTVMPLIEQSEPFRRVAAEPAASPLPAVADPQNGRTPGLDLELAPVSRAMPVPPGTDVRAQRSRRSRLLLGALAIPALLAVGLVPVWWAQSSRLDADREITPAASSRSGEAAASTSEPPHMAAASGTSRGSNGPATADTAEPTRRTPGSVGDARVSQPAAPTPAASDRSSGSRAAFDGASLSPSFSSVGSAMFYEEAAEGSTALVRAGADSRRAVLRITRIVDDEAKSFHARPSPDGHRVAFDSDRGGVRGVYVADADGTNVRRVSPEGFAAVPSWSPDGRTLAFVRAEPDRPDVWNLWTVEIDTGSLQRLTTHESGQPLGGSWFPDGKQIAYSHEDRLVIHELGTGAERVLPSPRKGRPVRTPAVSPDGQRVVFQVAGDGAWLLELTDGSTRRVLADPSAEEYAWSPDGRQVAYHSQQAGGWGVWMMAPRQR